MNCHQANDLIHSYLDEDLTEHEQSELKQHLCQCVDCRTHFHGLRQVIVFLQSASHVYAPENFTEKVMAQLPKDTFVQFWKKRMHRHPLLVAASLFVLLMAGSTYSLWADDKQFLLTTPRPEHLQINSDQNTVVVPADQTVAGDIVVRNGDIKIEGTVEGNVVAIDGHIFLASTGHITGEKEEISQVVEWVWYNLKQTVMNLTH